MRIISKPQLNTRTTLRLGGEALAEVWIEEQKDWDFLPQFLEREGGRPYVLGQGSNVLAASGQLPIVLIRLENSRSLIEVSQERDTVRIQAGCGMGLPRLMRWLQVYGLSGLEGLIGVPGSLGGAVAMNAGAYGCETAQRIKRCQFWTPEEGLFWKDSSAIDISYRHLSPGGKPTHRFWVATRVDLELIREEPKTLRTKMRHYYLQKKTSQPILTKTCGCVFKNPLHNRPAGYLLEQSGFRGFSLGKIAFSAKHANFLINLGGGESEQAFELLGLAQREVKKRFGLVLERELCLLEK